MKQENAKERCYGRARDIASSFAGVRITKKKDDCPEAREARILLYEGRSSRVSSIDLFTGEPRNAFQETKTED
jgi:hypothetical protein